MKGRSEKNTKNATSCKPMQKAEEKAASYKPQSVSQYKRNLQANTKRQKAEEKHKKRHKQQAE
jgi:hypothetical protein